MNRGTLILTLLLAVCALSGCDVLRRLAGRPTSEDIQAKRELIEARHQGHLDRLDSADNIRKVMADSLVSADSLAALQKSVVELRQLSRDTKLSLSKRYYIIIGAFSKSANAEKYAATAREKGFDSYLIKYSNGFTAVGVNPSNELPEAFETLVEIRSSGFCPDAWILDNRP